MNLTERRIARKWDRVMATVCQEIEAIPHQARLSGEEAWRLRRLISQIQSAFRGKDLFVHRDTLAELARKYATSERTISYWKRAGCPFAAGQWKVVDWLGARRVLPRRARAKFAKQLERRRKRAEGREFAELVRCAKALARMFK
jgi:hypothetical protein